MSPQVAIEIDRAKVTALVERVKAVLPEEGEYLGAFFHTVWPVFEELQKKSVSIARLRSMMFGASTEKTSCIFSDEAEEESLERDEECVVAKEPVKGHGRLAAEDYSGARRTRFGHEDLKHGDRCPCCGKGNVYKSEPGVLVLMRGRAPIEGEIVEQEKLRCGACGEAFSATLPDDLNREKYDETAASMLALLKYGSGFPFHRMERLQESLGLPLPASTIWEIVEEHSHVGVPVLSELVRLAAQGEVIYTDDTAMRILDVPEKLRQKTSVVEDDDDDEDVEASERTGVFTSAVVSKVEDHRIALFFTGVRHAGENLARVLAEREKDRGPPIEMCDGLSRNLPKPFEVILANCLTHGRRKFVEVVESFPTECRFVIECLKAVYEIDAEAKELGHSPEGRLALHQEKSRPVMDVLWEWLEWKIQARLVEPNSGLGKAIKYMKKRWGPMTLFLRKAGAPLDNNLAERTLKLAILHRKNSYFYKTENGARVGDLFMSLIHTCRLSKVNPFNYLIALQKNAERVRASPAHWLPWNYEAVLQAASPG